MSSTKHSAVAGLCRFTKRKRWWLARLPESNQTSLQRYLNSKAYPKSIIRDKDFLNSRKVLEGKLRPGNCESRARESDRSRTDPEVWQKKRKKYPGKTASLKEELHELCLTPWGGCFLSTLAYEGDKNTTKWKLKVSVYDRRRKRIFNFCRRSN